MLNSNNNVVNDINNNNDNNDDDDDDLFYEEYECVQSNQWDPPIPPTILVHPQVRVLARQFVYEQGSAGWLHARSLRVTASAVGNILNSGWSNPRVREPAYQQSELVMQRKAGFAEPFTGSAATLHGQTLEPEARTLYRQQTQQHLALFGLLVHPHYWFLGASPDGMCMATGRLLEIKCPKSRTVKAGNPILAHYWCQTQLQMEVCDVDECDFFEYRLLKRPPVQRTNTVHVTRSREWFEIVLPIFQQYVIHLYRMKALAALFRPEWLKVEGFAAKEHLL